ncbi:hypothetical protein NQ317_017786 [Molorchus minor]|uniref:Methyltransferase type 11 domain-containing protein n=1 Tax=Molorchus minor TaxID=1323400 RepID=A0ABQ9K0J8_9CUCU|nr:hypothetical protein NQ317_017786 [Molorchus minor]
MSRPEYLAPLKFFITKMKPGNTRKKIACLAGGHPCYLLDIGCGSGLSGSVLSDEGHSWIGMDISTAMLDVALEREVDGTFDGAIGISALQWLCNADKSSHRPVQRLYKFFSTLYACLSRRARAVLQFYPENSDQMELLTTQAMKAGFYGGIVVDYPNSTKAKKFFLVLMTGVTSTNLIFTHQRLILVRTLVNACRFVMSTSDLDIYRQTPIRYLGYTNEIGEAFRSIIGNKWVNFSYAVATAYVLADTVDKSFKSYKLNRNEKHHLKKVCYSTADALIWQMLASVAIPGFTINRVCAVSTFLLNKSEKIPKTPRKWIVTAIGLITIPFIIKPIDEFVDDVLDNSLRNFEPK